MFNGVTFLHGLASGGALAAGTAALLLGASVEVAAFAAIYLFFGVCSGGARGAALVVALLALISGGVGLALALRAAGMPTVPAAALAFSALGAVLGSLGLFLPQVAQRLGLALGLVRTVVLAREDGVVVARCEGREVARQAAGAAPGGPDLDWSRSGLSAEQVGRIIAAGKAAHFFAYPGAIVIGAPETVEVPLP